MTTGGNVGLLMFTMSGAAIALWPFAHRRWCGAAGIAGGQPVSVNSEFRLLARSHFVVDAGDRGVHVKYVPEVGDHPRYLDALAVARTARQQDSYA